MNLPVVIVRRSFLLAPVRHGLSVGASERKREGGRERECTSSRHTLPSRRGTQFTCSSMVHLLFSAKSWSSSRLIVIPMSCACKGIRSCLVCEEKSVEEKQRRASAGNNYYFCGDCGKINPEAETSFQEASAPICLRQCDGYRREIRVADRSMRENLTFGGIALLKDFLGPREEEELVSYIDSARWVESQSGRRKQVRGT